jgi:hypothetical protein
MEKTTNINRKTDIAKEVGDRLFKFIQIDEKGLTQEIEKMLNDHTEVSNNDLLWIILGILESHYDMTMSFSTFHAEMQKKSREYEQERKQKQLK